MKRYVIKHKDVMLCTIGTHRSPDQSCRIISDTGFNRLKKLGYAFNDDLTATSLNGFTRRVDMRGTYGVVL